MKQLLPCPDCQRLMLLPEATASVAKLRCPQCGNENTIEGIHNRLESWILVDEPYPGQAENETSAETNVTVETNPVGHVKSGANGSAKNSSRADLSVGNVSYARLGKLGRKKRSPLWSIVQVAVGGVAAVPISLLLIWHALGKDIAGAGPAVSRYVPWVVPKQFRAEVESPDSNPRIPFAQPPARGMSGFRQFDDVLEPESESEFDPKPEVAHAIPQLDDSSAPAIEQWTEESFTIEEDAPQQATSELPKSDLSPISKAADNERLKEPAREASEAAASIDKTP